MKPLNTSKSGKIYMVVNTFNGFKYIGQTFQNVARRWKNHISQARRGSLIELHVAIRYHGEDAFECVVLEDDVLVNEIDEKESHYIETLQTLVSKRGYNVQPGGALYHGCTEFTRQKMSKAMKGRVFTEEHRRRLSEANKRRHANSSKEVKAAQAEKMNAARLEKGCSEETREKLRKNMIGNSRKLGKLQIHSNETRLLQSQIKSAYWAKKREEAVQKNN